jgi:hypothetical protein
MKKIYVLIVVLAIAVTLLIATVVSAKTQLTRLEIINRTDQNVAISVIGESGAFYLPVAPGTTRVFTLEREVYQHTTFACGTSQTGSVDLATQLRLVFPTCYGERNQGAPTLEKVQLDSESRADVYRYQLNQ